MKNQHVSEQLLIILSLLNSKQKGKNREKFCHLEEVAWKDPTRSQEHLQTTNAIETRTIHHETCRIEFGIPKDGEFLQL